MSLRNRKPPVKGILKHLPFRFLVPLVKRKLAKTKARFNIYRANVLGKKVIASLMQPRHWLVKPLRTKLPYQVPPEEDTRFQGFKQKRNITAFSFQQKTVRSIFISLLTLLTIVAGYSLPARTAGTPFPCDGSLYISQAVNTPDPSQFNRVGTSTGFGLNPIGGKSVTYNAIGFRGQDGFIYGIKPFTDPTGDGAAPFTVYQIDSGGGATSLGAVSGMPPGRYFAGDFAADGTYYVYAQNTGQLVQLSVTSSPPTILSTKLLLSAPQFADIAFNPADSKFYGYDPTAKRMAYFDPTSPGPISVTYFGPSQTVTVVGAAFFDSSGNFYAYENSGALYRVDVGVNGSGTAAFTGLSTVSTVAQNDGAACPYSPRVLKTVAPTSVVAGGTVTYTYEIFNLSPFTLDNLTFTDAMPDGRTFVSGSLMDPLGGTPNAYGGTSTLTITALSIPARTDTKISVQVQVPPTLVTTPVFNQATLNGVPTAFGGTVFSAKSDYPPTAAFPDGTPLVISTSADVITTKSGPTGAPAPGNLTYTLTTTNKGISAAKNVVIRDQLATGSTFVSASDGGTASGSTVTWPAIATLGPSESVTRTVTVNLPANGSYTNIASSTSDTPDPTPGNNNGSLPAAQVTTLIPVATSADIVTTKSGPTGAPAPGNLTYTIVTKNNGPDAAANVVIRDQLATGSTFVSASDGGTASGSTVTWPAIATLGPSESVTRTVTVNLPANGSYTNIASSTSDTPDPTPGNNNGSLPAAQVTTLIPVATSADIVTTKSGVTGLPAPGTATYTITTTNNGPDAATNVVIRDQLATGSIFVSASDGGTASGSVVTWPAIATLSSGQSVTRTVTVNLPTNGSYTNTASSTSDTYDPTPANNNGSLPAAQVTTVVPAGTSADIVTTKSGVTGLPAPGTATYTITTTNNGPDAATNVVIRDQLATGSIFVSTSDGGTASGSVVTWPAIATLNSGQSVTRTVTVNLPSNGSYTNIASNTSDTPDPTPANNNGSLPAAQVTTLVPATATADLVTTKSGPTGAPTPGEVTYTIITKNKGTSTATNVVIRDQLAAGSTFVNASDGGTASGSVVTWPAITLNSGQSVARTVTVNPSTNGTYTDSASSTSDTPDPNPSDNNGSLPSSQVRTAIPGAATADVTISKNGADTVAIGNTIAYTLIVRSTGNADALNVTVSDPTPTGLKFASNSGDCTTAFPCNLGNIPPNQTRTITTTFNVPADYNGPNPYTNIATVNASNDSNPNNNTDTLQTRVTGGQVLPRLRLVKRITNVTRNGTPLGGINFGSFVQVNADDTAAGWPANFLLGVSSNPVGTPVQSGDEVEYTIYFLSDGGREVENAKFCDLIPGATMFSLDSFGAGSGISLNRSGTIRSLTNTADTDEGTFFSPLAPLPAGNVCSNQNNPDGAVLVNLGNLPSTAGNNYGFVRFRVKIK